MTRDANSPSPASADGAGTIPPGSGAPGSVDVLTGARATRVVLVGEIDADLGPRLVECSAAAEAARLPIEVDVRAVSFMDSTGVAFLARLASRSEERLVLIQPPELVRFLLGVTSINEVLEILDEDPGFEPAP